MQVESEITRMRNCMENKSFEIKIKPSNLSSEEKRNLLWQSFDILLINNNGKIKKSQKVQPILKVKQKK